MLNEDLARDVIYDKLEHLLRYRRTVVPMDVVRYPGKIIWTFRFEAAEQEEHVFFLGWIKSEVLCSFPFPRPMLLLPGDTLVIRYTLKWTEGGGECSLNPAPGTICGIELFLGV
jgi:hypothetical protein